jgi:hypothetical protein
VPCNLAKRGPIGARCDIFRAAAGASHLAADLWNREDWTQFGRKTGGGNYCVMPASVAPAKDVNMGFCNLAEPRCMTPCILGFDISAFVLTHRPAFG